MEMEREEKEGRMDILSETCFCGSKKELDLLNTHCRLVTELVLYKSYLSGILTHSLKGGYYPLHFHREGS